MAGGRGIWDFQRRSGKKIKERWRCRNHCRQPLNPNDSGSRQIQRPPDCGFFEKPVIKTTFRQYVYSIFTIVYSVLPMGVMTGTTSPFLAPMRDLPTNDSFEILPAAGLASLAPTIVYLVSLPLTITVTVEPMETMLLFCE